MTLTIGRVCVKIAGRDAGKKCVVLDIIDKNFVFIDGETRRRKCNILHLDPLTEILSVSKNATHEQVRDAFRDLGITVSEKKTREQTTKPLPLRKSKTKTAPVETKTKKTKPKESKKAKKK